MTQPSLTASDCNVLRGAFVKSVIEKNIPEDRWRDEAALLIRDYTDNDDVDSNLLEWIIRTGTVEP
jgi:sulfite reductase beta subunit-like hemoprotein